MKFSTDVKPVSYFKSHASEVVRDVVDNGKTMIITQNGEAKAVLQDIQSYEQMQESLALLKILVLNSNSLQERKYKSLEKSFKDIRSTIKARHLL